MKWTLAAIAFTLISVTWAQTTQAPDILSVLKAEGHYNTFADLLDTSGFLSQLNTSQHFTVFAPSDEAFASLPAGTLDALKADPNKLKDVLAYHLILNNTFRISTSSQDKVLIASNNQPIRINSYSIVHSQSAEGVNITRKNVPVLHGLLHEINGILTPPGGDIVALGSSLSGISTFESLITSANLTSLLTNDHSTTIFIPNDAAFVNVGSTALDYLKTHPQDLVETLKYHVVKSYALYSIGMTNFMTVTSADSHNERLLITKDSSGSLSVNGAKIIQKDIGSVNGVVHIIDTVLIPPRVNVAIAESTVAIG